MYDTQTSKKQMHQPHFPGSYFISLEGIEGAGKSMQIKNVKEYLESKNFRVILLREPGGTSFGEKLRKTVLDTKTSLHPLSELYLFAASRAQLLHEVTIQELATPGTVVLYDRYIDSTLAYQGHAAGLGFEHILDIHSQFPLNIMPHLTILLEIDLATSHKRQQARGNARDYFESKDDHFYQKLIDGFHLAAEAFPLRIKKVDGKLPAPNVFHDIQTHIDQMIFSHSSKSV